MMMEFLTIRDVAALLKVSYETALAFVRYSGVPYHKVGKQYRVEEDALRAFLRKKGAAPIDITGINN